MMRSESVTDFPPGDSFVMTQRVLKSMDIINSSSDIAPFFATKHSLPIDLKDHYRAFVHSSFVNECKGEIESNERLEFLGDAVLNILMAHILFSQYPELDEGYLSRLQASLINEESLYSLSLSSQLHHFILIGKGELNNRCKQGPLADVVEALLGSVFELEGLEAAKRLLQTFFVNYQLKTGRDYIDPERLDSFNPKGILQEKVMAQYQTYPEYVTLEEKRQHYKVALVINGKKVLTGKGPSKRQVQKALAADALQKTLYKKG